MTTKQDDADSAIRVIVFSRKKADWLAWEKRCLAEYTKKGYVDLYIRENKVVIPKKGDTLDATTTKMKTLHENAYSELIISMDTTTAHGLVALKRLKVKYTPETAPH